MNRCKWCNLKNPKYVAYHDEEWGVLRTDDRYLFEMLVLESFQAGLSWECILNKRENFRTAYDDFDLDKVCAYGEDKLKELSISQRAIFFCSAESHTWIPFARSINRRNESRIGKPPSTWRRVAPQRYYRE